MASAISSIRNLGAAFEAGCARAGIHTADELRTLGADATYAAMLRTGTPPHFIGYCALVMGLQNRPWNDCKDAEKKALRTRFDAIKAEAFEGNDAEFERLMNRIGVLSPTKKGQRRR